MSEACLLIETRKLVKRFGGVTAVAAVDFRLRQGEIRCLIGPNGAGKSTFFKLLSGQIPATSGEVFFNGDSMKGQKPFELARRGIGIKNQTPDVMNGLTVRENLWLAARASHGGAGADDAADALLEKLVLKSIDRRLVGELAHGQRQWVEIACVMATRPRLVLLDEPAAGMSDRETERTAELIKEINKDATIVVVEHDMQFIQRIAQQVTVFHQGAILVEDSFEAVSANPTVRDIYLGRGI